jgi:alpha-L-arabinofuranosidase
VKVDYAAADPLDLSVSASKNGSNGSELIVSFVNPKNSADMRIECSIAGKSAASAAAQILHHADLNAANTFEKPDTLMLRPYPVQTSGSMVSMNLPPLSVATVTIQMG